MTELRTKLRHLEAFAAVAREQTVQRAAQALSLTPSAISKALHELEDTVGRPLFKRTRKGLIATAEGEQLLRHVLPGLALLRDGLDQASGRRQKSGVYQVRVGVLPTAAAEVAPLAVQQLQARHERTEIQVVAGTNLSLLGLLREGELDMVVGRLPDPTLMFGLSFESLYAEPLVLVAAPSHGLARQATLSLVELLPYPMVLPAAGTAIRQTIDSFFIGAGIGALPRVTETLSESFARTLVRCGDAVWFCPLGAVQHELHDQTLVRLPIDTRATAGAVGLSLRADVEPHKAAQAMIEAIRAQAAQWRSRQ